MSDQTLDFGPRHQCEGYHQRPTPRLKLRCAAERGYNKGWIVDECLTSKELLEKRKREAKRTGVFFDKPGAKK